MKTLIVYASKYGFTADCVNLLKDKLQGEVTTVDINKVTSQLDLSEIDTVMIGGSIYVGKTSKKLREFCEKNLDALNHKKIGLFLCCALVENEAQLFMDNFSASLLENVKAKKIFGSDARLEKMNFLDKTIIKAVTKGDFSRFKISEENIDAFAREMS